MRRFWDAKCATVTPFALSPWRRSLATFECALSTAPLPLSDPVPSSYSVRSRRRLLGSRKHGAGFVGLPERGAKRLANWTNADAHNECRADTNAPTHGY
jgi:hypothetical protein